MNNVVTQELAAINRIGYWAWRAKLLKDWYHMGFSEAMAMECVAYYLVHYLRYLGKRV